MDKSPVHLEVPFSCLGMGVGAEAWPTAPQAACICAFMHVIVQRRKELPSKRSRSCLTGLTCGQTSRTLMKSLWVS